MLRKEDIPEEALKATKIVHFGSVSLTADPARTATLDAAARAKKLGAIITYDPNYRANLWHSEEEAIAQMKASLPLVDILKVSDEGAAPADRHHRLRKRHGAAGTKRHSADFCHLGCKRCVVPLWRKNRSCSRCSLQGGRHQRCRRHLLWGSAVQAVQGGFELPDGRQAGKYSGFCQQGGQHHHQPPRCHPRHAHSDRSGGLTHGAGIFRTICPP